MEKNRFSEIIEYIARNRIIEELITNCKVEDDDLQDLAQDIYLYLIEKQPKQLIIAYNNGDIKNYLSRIVVNNLYSKTSPYYYKYKKHKLNQLELQIEDEIGD